jgi:hypothetical protein
MDFITRRRCDVGYINRKKEYSLPHVPLDVSLLGVTGFKRYGPSLRRSSEDPAKPAAEGTAWIWASHHRHPVTDLSKNLINQMWLIQMILLSGFDQCWIPQKRLADFPSFSYHASNVANQTKCTPLTSTYPVSTLKITRSNLSKGPGVLANQGKISHSKITRELLSVT